MGKQKQLRLSLYTVPDLSIGRAPLTPQNSQFDRRRIEYLKGMVARLNEVHRSLRKRQPESDALDALRTSLTQSPYAELVQIKANGSVTVSEIAGARDRIGFYRDRLKIVFLDGLHRRIESPAIPSGRHTPEVCHVISKLAQGIPEGQLVEILARRPVDLSAVILGLRDLELIEESDAEQRAPQSFSDAGVDRLTWLGHACVLFQTRRSSICVDPFLRPHIRWTEEDLKNCFSDSFGENFFFNPYGPQLTQLSPAQLPPLDAVFLTHQDTDHCNMGVLMMLPEDTPIIVPEYCPDHSWEVDLSALIRKVLGPKRKVIRLRHGETISIGDIRATAFPFFAEMPSSLTTLWNCYLFETDRTAVACTADSALTDASVDFLAERLGRQQKPFTLCSRPVHSGRKSAGYRDESENLFNFTRLWAWYVPIWDLFHPVEVPGISLARLRNLCRKTNPRFYLPYAMGTAPWYRIADVNDPLHVPIANLSACDLNRAKDALGAIPKGPVLFPGKFAQPLALD